MPNAGKNQNYVVASTAQRRNDIRTLRRTGSTLEGIYKLMERTRAEAADANGWTFEETATARARDMDDLRAVFGSVAFDQFEKSLSPAVANDTPAPLVGTSGAYLAASLLTEHSPARVDDFDLTPNYDALFDRFSRDIVAQPLLDLIQHDTDALHHFNSLMAALDIAIMSAHTTAQLAVVRHKVHAALGKASVAYQAALADDDARGEATEL